mmetsp:Transcript_86077/g.257994  ORF Transcript_86077/g.257994 Transcript_86077/m.257994 type:complete len:202 (+) Transcript_86077:116-721(+)
MKTSCMLVAKVHIGLPVVTYHFLGTGKSWPALTSRLWVTSDALRSSNDITKVVKRQLADGAAASLGLRDGNHRGHDGDRPIVNVSGLATWCPACSSSGGRRPGSCAPAASCSSQRPASASCPPFLPSSKSMAALSRAPEAVGRNAQGGPPHAMLSEVLHLSVGRRLALGAPSGSDSAPGVSGYLRAALRMRLSCLFARFGP